MNRLLVLVWLVLGGGLLVLLLAGTQDTIGGFAKDDIARMIALGAVAMVIASGFVMRRGISDTVRGLAGWLAIVLALVAGYQYRYELQDVASRVTAGLVPGSPLSVTDAEGRVTVMIEKRGNGHFEANGTVEGAPIDFLVDTGATSTVLTMDDARRAGFGTSGLAFDIPVSTANGVTRAASARAREIVIGGIVRRNLPIMIAAEGTLEGSLLGMNFISTLSGFDMRGDRLILRD